MEVFSEGSELSSERSERVVKPLFVALIGLRDRFFVRCLGPYF